MGGVGCGSQKSTAIVGVIRDVYTLFANAIDPLHLENLRAYIDPCWTNWLC